ncbi:MAG: Trk family potassium uptake protein [Clostridia bacterium]|nr:Trk family potassium uptake protein [Clostridia bacterium]
MAAGFLMLILLGGVLLSLPVSAKDGQSIGIGNGFFTAASAVCVTGLIVVDTGTTFSLFGQLVLIVLIQIGGLGFMVFATLVMAALGRRITLRGRMIIRESMNTATLAGLVQLTCWYSLLAAGIELLGAAILCVRFVPLLGWGKGLYYSVWHAVSAFCNAGFDLFGQYSSLTGFQHDPMVLLTVAVLIILGGTGFAVISEVIAGKLRRRAASLHTRLVLISTAALLLGGTAFIALVEWRNPATLGAVDGAGYRLVNAFFQSATMRTAGFNSIDLASMHDGTKLFSALLMFVGASSASTGGGVKTTTVAVLLLSVWSVIRGGEETVVLGRRLPAALTRRALAIVMVATLLLLTGTLTLTLAEGGRIPLIDLLFETASALATVGVTSAGTPGLTAFSRTVLVPLMYLGRVGPLTMAFALADRQRQQKGSIRYPEENITIG